MQQGIEARTPNSIRSYLNEIAERLWAGRAAVMIGAGFSKNAGNEFPDWNQLGDIFFHKAHGTRPDPNRDKYLNPLRLAEELQAAIGRPALEHLLQSSIPDLNIEPSDSHVDLLELPWVDVFTTNYDTLLERASAKVLTRRYEPVVNKEDIPYATKPRIVKLHGSFPSERPFIITDEDYRRYPNDHAPFVNTVQQALLENTFCLIGFSGDDPNFLKWIGWIRDNIGGEKTQKIYLIGVFDLSSARLQLLAQRGIIVIDFSCFHEIEKEDHKKALSTFFEYMQSKKPNEMNWPDDNGTDHYLTENVDHIKAFREITLKWQQQRRAYPGWLILPHDNRSSLWIPTQYWINHLPDIEESPTGLDIRYAFELIWRLERCLLPVFTNLAVFCEKLLEKYWPFHTQNPPLNYLIHPKNENHRDLPWDDLREAWLAIALAMLRFYREEGALEQWKNKENQLKTLSNYLSPEQKEFLHYENFLFNLFILDLPNAKQSLERWETNESQPYWMAKRAAALGEIGLLNEAETLVKDALVIIRKKLNQKAGPPDITLLSLESNAMLLGKYIQDAASLQRDGLNAFKSKFTQFNDRWNELKGFKCDPWNELKLFELTLRNPYHPKSKFTEKSSFDIGKTTRSQNSNTDKESLAAYSFLRFCEDIGLPFHIGNYVLAVSAATASLQRIENDSPFWASATFFRTGNVKAADSMFSRESVHKLTPDDADELIKTYLDTLQKCREDIYAGDDFRNKNYAIHLSHLLPEIISRLFCRCSINKKIQVIDFIKDLYSSPHKAKYGNTEQLFPRLINSLSDTEQYKFVSSFINVPFPENLHAVTRRNFPNPLLVVDIDSKSKFSHPIPAIPPETIKNLLDKSVSEDIDHRRWSISSLIKLYQLGLLTSEQGKTLGECIWHKTDSFGLPEGTDFYKFAFLSYPHPDHINPVYLFKAYIKATPFPDQNNQQKNSFSMTWGNIPIVKEILGANCESVNIWTTEDAIEILERSIQWWQSDKEKFGKHQHKSTHWFSRHEEFRLRSLSIIKLIISMIAPKFSINTPDSARTALRQLIVGMREHGIPTLRAESASLHIYPEETVDVHHRIHNALLSNEDESERDGLEAIFIINQKHLGIEGRTVKLHTIPMLCQYLTWSPSPSISKALWIAIKILKASPESFSEELKITLLKRIDRIFSETKYDDNGSNLTFDEKLSLRRVTAILAVSLQGYYLSLDQPIPDIIEKWRDRCLSSDEFAEVRIAWENEL